MSKGKKKNASEQNEARALILRILVGFVAGMIVMLLMMAIFSSIIVKSDLTGAVVYILGLLACCFATFLSGFVVTRPFHKKGLPFGILAALPLTASWRWRQIMVRSAPIFTSWPPSCCCAARWEEFLRQTCVNLNSDVSDSAIPHIRVREGEGRLPALPLGMLSALVLRCSLPRREWPPAAGVCIP